jgi:hypothetical protein
LHVKKQKWKRADDSKVGYIIIIITIIIISRLFLTMHILYTTHKSQPIFFTQLASNCSVPPLFYSNGSRKAAQIRGPWNPSNPTATCISTHNQKEHPHQDQSTILVKVKNWFEFIFFQKKKKFGFLIFFFRLLSQLYHSHLFF